MEKGFYHPQRGYWQTTGEVPQRVLEGYPTGTVEVPVRPSEDHEWRGGAWSVNQALAERRAARATAALAASSIAATARQKIADVAGLTAEEVKALWG